MDELDDPDLDGEPALLDDLPIIIALLAGAIAIFYILYSNWTTTPRSPAKQEPSNSEEDTNSSEADKPEDLFGDSDNSDENEMDVDFPEDEEYYMVKIDHGLMQFKKIEDEKEQERLHATIEHEVTSSDEDESDMDLDLTPEEFQECIRKFERRRTSLMKRPVEGSIDKEQEPYPAATGIQKPSDLGGGREDVGPLNKPPSNLDQGTVQLSDSYDEISAADVLKRIKIEKKDRIEEEGDTPIAQESFHAEREDADTTTVPTSKSVETTVREISLDESREDTLMEKDTVEEHEGGENEVTSTEETATGMSSDEKEEDASTMEKDTGDEEHEGVDEVTSAEGKDVIPMANDDPDVNRAKPEYVRVSSSVMERRASRFSPGDADFTTSDNSEVMIGSSSTEVAPCVTSTMDSNESASEDQTSQTNEDDENWGEEQLPKESLEVEVTQEEQDEQDVTTLPAEEDYDEWED